MNLSKETCLKEGFELIRVQEKGNFIFLRAPKSDRKNI